MVLPNFDQSASADSRYWTITARDWQRSELTSSSLSRFRHKYNKKHCRSTFDDFAFLLMACYGVGSGTMVHIARLQVNRPSVVPLAVWAVNKTTPPTTQTWLQSSLDQQQQQLSYCKPTSFWAKSCARSSVCGRPNGCACKSCVGQRMGVGKYL